MCVCVCVFKCKKPNTIKLSMFSLESPESIIA